MAFSDLNFSGFWDALANKILNAPAGTPQSLTDGPTTEPLLYYIAVAGKTPLGDVVSWAVGDWALNWGMGWVKIGADGSGGGSGGVPPLVTLVSRLIGGNPNQLLAKNTSADYDFKWVSPFTGGGSFVFLDEYAIPGQTTWDQALVAAGLALPKGGVIYAIGASADYTFANPVIPVDTVLVGPYEQMPYPGTNQNLNLNGLQYFRLKSGGTFTLSAGAGLANCVIAPDGMTFPQPNSNAWAGTAITISGDQTLVRNCLAMGFNTAYYSTERQRGVVNHFFFDSNNGLYLKNIYDTTRMFGLHGWPFATIQKYSSSTGSDPAGRDASINYRSGTGMTMVLDVDDLYVDSAIMVGFKIGYDFQAAQGSHFGRAWSECYSLPNTIGIKFGPNTDNNYIADAQVWGCDVPVLVGMADGSGNRVSFGHIRSVNSNYHGMLVQGGNVSFNVLEVRGTKEGNYALNITGTQSMVEGTVIDEGGATNTPSVAMPNPSVSPLIELLKVRAPYKAAGVSKFGVNPIYAPYTYIDGQTLKITTGGTFFKVPNGGVISNIAAAYGTREITLLFVGATQVAFGAPIAGPGQGFTSAAGGVAKFYFDAEYNSWRFMQYADTTVGAIAAGGGSGGSGGSAPAASIYGNTSGGAATPGYFTLGQFLDTIVNSPGSMVARGPSGWVAVQPGQSGQTLVSQGSGGPPIFTASSGGSAVTNMRQTFAGDLGAAAIGSGGNLNVYEPYSGAAVTGLAGNSQGVLTGGRWRYQQYFINGSWYTSAYQ